MQLSARQQQIVARIDRQVTKLLTSGRPSRQIEEALLNLMPQHMTGFKHLLDTLSHQEIDRLCARYTGFYHFAKMLERVAQGCAAGIFDDLIDR